MEECHYEKYRVFTDSISSNTWVNGSQSSFVTHLVRPLKNVTEVSVNSGSIDVAGSNVCYIKCEELISHFNVCGTNSNLNFDPTTQTLIPGSLVSVPLSSSGRTIIREHDFDTTTKYFNPIRSIDRLSITLLDENGEKATLNSNTFLTFCFTCKRENLC